MRVTFTCATAAVLSGMVLALAVPAQAACKRFGFTVNDYGKEGPTKDAKDLLDKHIAEWATQNGIVEYQTGKKSVSCELFLDVVLFDEHTCTATANVCWGGSSDASVQEAELETPPTPVRKVAQEEPAGAEPMAASTEAGSDANVTAKPDKPVTAAASADATPEPAAEEKGSSATADAAAGPFKEAASDTELPPAKAALEAMTAAKQAKLTATTKKNAPDAGSPASAMATAEQAKQTLTAKKKAAGANLPASAVVETGALPEGQPVLPVVKADTSATKVAPQAKTKPTTAAKDDKNAAVAAAVAAAERAAVAAEKAAAAAKQAAAAALLAAREAGQGPTAPALEPAPDAEKPARASAKRPQ